MSRLPILIMCLGGQGASVLARTLHACGMEVGNGETWWEDYFEVPHCEHMYLTHIMSDVYKHTHVEDRAHSLSPLAPRERWEPRLRELLQRYRREAEERDWKCYGVKTTSGICNEKWDGGVGDVLLEEWPDALYMGVYRKPVVTADDGWSAVWHGRRGMLERGGVFVPFPEAWQRPHLIREIVEGVGLRWTDEVLKIYQEPFDQPYHVPDPMEEEQYYADHPVEYRQRVELLMRSVENFEKVRERVGGLR